MAPQESQDIIKEYGRPEYEKLIAENPAELPLSPDKLVYAFGALGRADRRREAEVTGTIR